MKKVIGLLVVIAASITLSATAQNKIEVEFKTGDDDLAVRDAGIQSNLKITINYKNGTAPVVLENANRNQNWPKNSIRRVSIPLPANANVNNLASINLQRSTTNNNFEDAVADNWDLKSLAVTATIKNDSVNAKYQLLVKSGNPLNRFKAGINCNCNKTYDFSAPQMISGTSHWIDKFPPPQKASIMAIFGNGGDDLRGGNDNAKLIIIFKNSTRTLVYNNLNGGANWGNFTEKTVSKELPSTPDLKIADIKEVQLWHTGGGGMGADNWDLDKFKLTITINGENKILVDTVGAPIHRFTGDTRRKTFIVE